MDTCAVSEKLASGGNSSMGQQPLTSSGFKTGGKSTTARIRRYEANQNAEQTMAERGELHVDLRHGTTPALL
jgi:hypothetical protein